MDQFQDRKAYMDMPLDERPHLFPGLSPSNSTYSKSPGCRCRPCTDAHRGATRDYLADKANGVWTDRRKTGKTRELFNDLAAMAMDYPPLAGLLRRYGHEPLIIRVVPEPVPDGPMPSPAAAEPRSAEHPSEQVPQLALEDRTVDAGTPVDPAPTEAVTGGSGAFVESAELAQQVYSDGEPRTAEEAAAEILREAMRIARVPGGKLPNCDWMLSAPKITDRFKLIRGQAAVETTRMVGFYVKISGGGVALMKWPTALDPVMPR